MATLSQMGKTQESMPVRYFLQSEGTNNAVFSAGPTPNPVYGSRELNLQEAQQFLQSNPNVPFNPLRTGPSDPFNISREDIIAGNIGDTNRFGSYTDPLTGEQLSNVSISQIQGAQNRYTGVQSGILKDVGGGKVVPTGTPADIGQQNPESLETGRPLNAEDILRARGEGTPNEIPVNQLLPGGLPQFDEQGRPIQPTQQDFDKFREGFNAAKEAGITSPDTVGGAAEVIGKYTPSTPSVQGPDQISTFLQADPFLNQITAQFQAYINEQNQRASLVETYQSMLKESGIQEIDTELLNMKNIIEGTEDDIRAEVTKAGGFATDSQVLALTNARNKQLIKNYNTLLETRNMKEKYLDNMMQLSVQDRAEAAQRFDTMMNYTFKIAEYQQQMKQNAIASLDRTINAIGWDGLLNATQDDPYTQRLIERTYGLPIGGLQEAGFRAMQNRIFAEQQQQLETQNLQLGIQAKQEQILTSQAQRDLLPYEIAGAQADIAYRQAQIDNIYSEIQSRGIQDAIDLQKQQPEGGIQVLAQVRDDVELINSLVTDSNLGAAVGTVPFFGRFDPVATVTGGRANFVAGVEQMRSQLNLDALIGAKARGATFGQLSNQELQVLANAASKIGSWAVTNDSGKVTGYNASEKDFRAELDRINYFAKLDYILKGGNPEDVGAITTPDGVVWTRNSNGTISELIPAK